jgi:predicted nucleic acid-binding protein
MQLVDTIALIGAINVESEYHSVASRHLDRVKDDDETYVPLTSLMEFDLVMKGRNYTFNQRKDAFNWLTNFIPQSKIIGGSVDSFKIATELEETGMGYFDSLISAIAIEKNAIVLTTDAEISRVVKTKWAF